MQQFYVRDWRLFGGLQSARLEHARRYSYAVESGSQLVNDSTPSVLLIMNLSNDSEIN